jgi:hypothetical protein
VRGTTDCAVRSCVRYDVSVQSWVYRTSCNRPMSKYYDTWVNFTRTDNYYEDIFIKLWIIHHVVSCHCIALVGLDCITGMAEQTYNTFTLPCQLWSSYMCVLIRVGVISSPWLALLWTFISLRYHRLLISPWRYSTHDLGASLLEVQDWPRHCTAVALQTEIKLYLGIVKIN